ncbi:MAG: ATP-dependent DNA helicase [Acidobacteria bacterium]|nr:ATP-dependent DNA helicase [Acidobacteriota bacterium]
MKKGIEWHLTIQAKRSKSHADYQREQTVKGVIETPDGSLELMGRIDGIFQNGPILEEIKSTPDPQRLLIALEDPQHPYRKQLEIYALLWSMAGNAIAGLQLCLVNAMTGEETLCPIEWQATTIQTWANQRAVQWLDHLSQLEAAWRQRIHLAENLRLPYDAARPGQLALIETIETAIQNGQRLLVQAPTGTGKTVSSLLPALRQGLLQNRPVVFLTAKNRQQDTVAETIRAFRSNGVPIRALFMRSRERACLNEEVICHKDYCRFALQHYDKCNQGQLYQTLESEAFLPADRFAEIGQQFEVCPFQLSLDMMQRVDLIVCDYNYWFRPKGGIQNLFEEMEVKPILIIDECHNLPDRVQSHWHAAITAAETNAFLGLANQMQGKVANAMRRILTVITDQLKSWSQQWGAGTRPVDVEFSWLAALEEQTVQTVLFYLAEKKGLTAQDPVLDWYRWMADLFRVADGYGPHYRALWRGEAGLILLCCDPAPILEKQWRNSFATIGMSATLKPFVFYNDLLGLGDKTEWREFPDPFPRHNRKTLLIPQVSTKFRNREREAPRIADLISRIFQAHPGNYAIFFPSFGFLEQVAGHLHLKGARIKKQTAEIQPIDQEKILKALRGKRKNVVLLAVQGGHFGEGVDFIGDQLIGALIVGPALPQFSPERELMRQYFQERYQRGFAYAYAFPAMARSIQAAGRVIRSEHDRGMVLFIDERFLHPDYACAFPEHWMDQHPREWIPQSLMSELAQFWAAASNEGSHEFSQNETS